MDLATIPLPDTGTGLTIASHAVSLPTAPGMATGIVHTDGRVTTAQCSVCLRTATGLTPAAVVIFGHWRFDPDPGEPGHVKYRRCPDCRDARRHPAEQLDMLAYLEEMTS